MTSITIPSDLWEGDEETGITSWFASEGASVSKGALIAEIMTAKTQYEIHAPAPGRLHIIHDVDAVVAKGTVIGEVT